MPSVQFEGEGHQPGQAAPTTQSNTTPDDLTPEKIEALVQDAVRKAYRSLQSDQSKQELRIKQFVQQQVNALKVQGIEVTQEAERAIAATVKEQFAEPEDKNGQAPQPAQVAQPQKPVAPSKDPSEAFAIEQAELYDVEPLDENDPEAATLKEAKSLKDWKRMVAEATRAKAERIQAEPPKPKPIPNATGFAGVNRSETMAEAYKKEILANRGAGFQKLREIKDKYRKAGFDPDAQGGITIR